MGATNVMLAYRLYAGRVQPLSMQLLAYMALVSLDDDDKPWYGQGYEALAVFALGRPAPVGRGDLEAVRRAMKPLLDIGAVVTDRRASPRRDGPKTARYRLHLVPEMPQGIDAPLVDNPAEHHNGQPERPTESVQNDPQKPCQRPTKTVSTTHGNRGTEEPRGTTRSKEEENRPDLESDSLPSTGTLREPQEFTDIEAASPPDEPPTDPDCCATCGVLLDPDRTCRNRHCADGVAPVIPIRRYA